MSAPIDYSVTAEVRLLVALVMNEEVTSAPLFKGDLATTVRFVMDLEIRHRALSTIHTLHDCGIGKVLLTAEDAERISQMDDFPQN
jgi:hypothetical protein